MTLSLYNTRTRRVEPFTPLEPSHVRVYVCGLTPSARAHLGHARSFLFFDVLRRYLLHLGYRVTYVQNVTDIDDRSINRAKETGENWRDIVTGYYAEFRAAMQKLGVAEPDEEPYATAFVPQILAMIERLMAQGYAYRSNDGVYYRVSRFDRYGQLSRRNVDELQAGARIEVDENKDDPLDFALWKFAKPGEPKWPSPWGDGRPGWHIECSAMSHALLDTAGTGFDIHGGGADLIFPHHENEIAQSEPLMARPPMAAFWVHGGLLLFDNRKMSKSLGNFEPLPDVLERHDPQAIRLLFLQTGYRKVMNFTEDSIAAAAIGLDRIKNGARLLRAASSALPAQASLADVRAFDAEMSAALDDDMNTAVAVSHLYRFVSKAPAFAQDTALASQALDALQRWLGILGIPIDVDAPVSEEPPLPEDLLEALRRHFAPDVVNANTAQALIDAVIEVRAQARAARDWAESDRLRDVLAACGVALKDSKDGTTWSIAK